MQTVSASWNAAARYGTRALFTTATLTDAVTGAPVPIGNQPSADEFVGQIPIKDGAVTIDSTAKMRMSLDLTTVPSQHVWDALSVFGREIRITATTGYIDHTSESINLGVYEVGVGTMGYGSGDSIVLAGISRWGRVQRAKFTLNRSSVPTNLVPLEIKRLVEGAWAGSSTPFPGWAKFDTSVTAQVGTLLWADGDREAAIDSLATPHGLQVYFDVNGMANLTLIPDLSTSSAPVWTVDAGANGVMVGADRSRDATRTRNAVVVSYSGSTLYLPPQLVTDTLSTDPLNVNGALGIIPFYYSSPLFTSVAMMIATGKTLLAQQLSNAEQVSFSQAPNYALDADDVLSMVYPRITRTDPGDTELHILQQVVHPLLATTAQTGQCRTTRPDDDAGS